MIYPPIKMKKSEKSELYMPKNIYDEIYYDVKKSPDETFGIFMGTRKDNRYFITHLIDEGINAEKSPTHIAYDHNYVNHRINRLLSIYPNIQFLGLYHKHPSGFRQFSTLDYTAMKGIYKEVKAPFLSFLAFDKGKEGVEFLTFIYDGKEAKKLNIDFHILGADEVFSLSDISENFIHYDRHNSVKTVYITPDIEEYIELSEKKLHFENLGNSINVIVKHAPNEENYIQKLNDGNYRLKLDNKFFLIREAQVKVLDFSGVEKRTEGILSINDMKNKKVLIVGAGSIGGNVLLNLVRLGVGEIDIIDFDELKSHNPFRHELGLDSIGLTKVKALKERAKHINPFVRVNAYPKPFERFRVFDSCEEKANYDLIISTADSRLVHLKVNEYAEEVGAKFMAISLTSKGEEGEIFVYIPDGTGSYKDLLKKANIDVNKLERENSAMSKMLYVDAEDINENVIPVIYPQVIRIVGIGLELCIKLLEGKIENIKEGNFWLIKNDINSNKFLKIDKFKV